MLNKDLLLISKKGNSVILTFTLDYWTNTTENESGTTTSNYWGVSEGRGSIKPTRNFGEYTITHLYTTSGANGYLTSLLVARGDQTVILPHVQMTRLDTGVVCDFIGDLDGKSPTSTAQLQFFTPDEGRYKVTIPIKIEIIEDLT